MTTSNIGNEDKFFNVVKNPEIQFSKSEPIKNRSLSSGAMKFIMNTRRLASVFFYENAYY